jgi:hypothetical protein
MTLGTNTQSSQLAKLVHVNSVPKGFLILVEEKEDKEMKVDQSFGHFLSFFSCSNHFCEVININIDTISTFTSIVWTTFQTCMEYPQMIVNGCQI